MAVCVAGRTNIFWLIWHQCSLTMCRYLSCETYESALSVEYPSYFLDRLGETNDYIET